MKLAISSAGCFNRLQFPGSKKIHIGPLRACMEIGSALDIVGHSPAAYFRRERDLRPLANRPTYAAGIRRCRFARDGGPDRDALWTMEDMVRLIDEHTERNAPRLADRLFG